MVYQTIFHQTKFSKTLPNQPTAIIYGLTSMTYNKEGYVKTNFTSSVLTNFSTLHQNLFLKPNIKIYNPGKAPWHITADKAIYRSNIKQLIFKDHVILQQNSSPNNPATVIKTSELTVYPDKHYAITKKPVTLVQISADKSKMTVKAVGVEVYQKTGIVKLLSHARGHYEPKA